MSDRRAQGIAHLTTILTLPVVIAIAVLGESWWGGLIAFLVLGGGAVMLYLRQR